MKPNPIHKNRWYFHMDMEDRMVNSLWHIVFECWQMELFMGSSDTEEM